MEIEDRKQARVTRLTPVWYWLYKAFNAPANYFRNLWGQF